MMDALMLGIGVGFDTLGANTLDYSAARVYKRNLRLFQTLARAGLSL